MASRIVDRTLPVQLTHGETMERVKLLRHHISEVRILEIRDDEHKAEMNRLKKEHDVEMSRLTQEIADEAELRRVQCEYVANLEQRMMEVIRMDTGEVVEKRRMTAEEEQQYFQTNLLEGSEEEQEEEAVAQAAGADED